MKKIILYYTSLYYIALYHIICVISCIVTFVRQEAILPLPLLSPTLVMIIPTNGTDSDQYSSCSGLERDQSPSQSVNQKQKESHSHCYHQQHGCNHQGEEDAHAKASLRSHPHPPTILPLGVLIDSYKASHPSLYPTNTEELVAYGEFRRAWEDDPNDQRILFTGLPYLVHTYVARRWTRQDIEQADTFFSTHGPGGSPFPFPRQLLQRIVDECNGWFPVRIAALPEGTVIYPHTPVYVVTAEAPFASLITWLETLLTLVWYPTTVATQSRRLRDLIEEALERSADPPYEEIIESRVHDFGFRGCTSVEQALVGGTAHLLSFRGSDTALAGYWAQFGLNEGQPVAQSIPATEHAVMLAHASEREAMLAAISTFGMGAYAIVMDTFDYERALGELLPSLAGEVARMPEGFLVVRPDSGDPCQAVLQALEALERVFGAQTNEKGYRVIRGAGVIQGDGVGPAQVRSILEAVLAAGYSAQSIAFGMGSALLQRGLHRDTLSFATKLCSVTDAMGQVRPVCKAPLADVNKTSLPGKFVLARRAVSGGGKGPIMVFPDDGNNDTIDDKGIDSVMEIIYDRGPVHSVSSRRSFTELREASLREWRGAPKTFDPISSALREKQNQCIHRIRNRT